MKDDYLEQLFNTISILRRLLSSQSQESHEEKVATALQFSALKYLNTHKNSNVKDLAEYLKLSKSSATQLAERLSNAGLIERMNDQADRRIIHLVINPEGVNEYNKLRKKFIDRLDRIFSYIPAKDLKELIRIHNNIIESLNN